MNVLKYCTHRIYISVRNVCDKMVCSYFEYKIDKQVMPDD